MRVALTGGTGFLGRYLVRHLLDREHQVRAWHRPTSDRTGIQDGGDTSQGTLEWIAGELGQSAAAAELVAGCDAVIHAALDRPSSGFRGAEGDLVEFVERNVVGTLRLIEAARAAGVPRFVFISTCAVHEVILDDRPLDEAHPLWPTSHYGAHKAALEKFVHSYGLGQGYPICALRPTGIYGLAHPPQHSKWYGLVKSIVRGEPVQCRRGGKEVHAADVARAAGLLLEADDVAGQAYNCYDLYVSDYEVAHIAKNLTGSASPVEGQPMTPKHQILANKLRSVGMQFGGRPLLEHTVSELVQAVESEAG